jgi:hypothetical protein
VSPFQLRPITRGGRSRDLDPAGGRSRDLDAAGGLEYTGPFCYG